jgi:hypothetical protein
MEITAVQLNHGFLETDWMPLALVIGDFDLISEEITANRLMQYNVRSSVYYSVKTTRYKIHLRRLVRR